MTSLDLDLKVSLNKTIRKMRRQAKKLNMTVMKDHERVMVFQPAHMQHIWFGPGKECEISKGEVESKIYYVPMPDVAYMFYIEPSIISRLRFAGLYAAQSRHQYYTCIPNKFCMGAQYKIRFPNANLLDIVNSFWSYGTNCDNGMDFTQMSFFRALFEKSPNKQLVVNSFDYTASQQQDALVQYFTTWEALSLDEMNEMMKGLTQPDFIM